MKKLLSVVLSMSLLFASANSYCFAQTAWNSCAPHQQNYERVPEKSISVFKQKNGEKVIVQGEESPTIVINNKSESKASAHASGGSTFSKLFLLAIKVGVGALAAKWLFNKLKIWGGNMSDVFSKGCTDFKDFVTNIASNITASTTNKDNEFVNEPDYDNEFQNDSGFFNKIITLAKTTGAFLTGYLLSGTK